jgi:hypothetical protein
MKGGLELKYGVHVYRIAQAANHPRQSQSRIAQAAAALAAPRHQTTEDQ